LLPRSRLLSSSIRTIFLFPFLLLEQAAPPHPPHDCPTHHPKGTTTTRFRVGPSFQLVIPIISLLLTGFGIRMFFFSNVFDPVPPCSVDQVFLMT